MSPPMVSRTGSVSLKAIAVNGIVGGAPMSAERSKMWLLDAVTMLSRPVAYVAKMISHRAG
jgi:hypothetical protein